MQHLNIMVVRATPSISTVRRWSISESAKTFGGVALLIPERIVSEQVDCREKSWIVMGG